MINIEEINKNTRLTDFEGIREFVIANQVRGMKVNRKVKQENRILDEF